MWGIRSALGPLFVGPVLLLCIHGTLYGLFSCFFLAFSPVRRSRDVRLPVVFCSFASRLLVERPLWLGVAHLICGFFFETSSDKSGLFFCCWDLVRTCLLLLPFPPCRIFTDGGEESRREVIHGGRRYPAAMCPNGKGMLLFPSCLGNLVTE